MGTPATLSAGPVDGPAVEPVIARDVAKRAAMAAPLICLVAGLIHGWSGAATAAVAVAIVALNMLAAAWSLATAARISLSMIMVAALGGFMVRMGILMAIILALRNLAWIDLPTLAIVVLVTQLGVLFWEMRYVSATLAYPALKPGHKGA